VPYDRARVLPAVVERDRVAERATDTSDLAEPQRPHKSATSTGSIARVGTQDIGERRRFTAQAL
jgi:hypothetical protein